MRYLYPTGFTKYQRYELWERKYAPGSAEWGYYQNRCKTCQKFLMKGPNYNLLWKTSRTYSWNVALNLFWPFLTKLWGEWFSVLGQGLQATIHPQARASQRSRAATCCQGVDGRGSAHLGPGWKWDLQSKSVVRREKTPKGFEEKWNRQFQKIPKILI